MAKYKKHHKGQKAKPNMKPSEKSKENDHICLRFQALDTWFFRESRPHDAAGASELSSLFPPPIRTLIGAIRSYIGNALSIDWESLNVPDFDFVKVLGGSDDLGQLQLNGAWLSFTDQRLYPAPLYLMQKENDIRRLQPGSEPVQCDLGTVRLPVLAPGLHGYKNLEQRWLTAEGLRKCLNGEVPSGADVISPDKLFKHEGRLGIARDNELRQVQDGKLYQTQHLRLEEDVAIELDIKHLPSKLAPLFTAQGQLIRLGCEGRMASMATVQEPEPLPTAKAAKAAKAVNSIAIHFITAADFKGNWYPPGFTETTENGQTVWTGNINGIKLSIVSAVLAKVQREGGWDLAENKPRTVKSYLPAGSVWFCRLLKGYNWQTLQTKLHGLCIGEDTAFGRGQILLGHWQDDNTPYLGQSHDK